MRVPTWDEYREMHVQGRQSGILRHTISSEWVSAEDNWRCPCCDRTKFEILRWRQLNCGEWRWLGELHWHHDHVLGKFSDVFRQWGLMQRYLARDHELGVWDAEAYAYWNSQFRFPDTLMCMDCNWAEGSSKSKLKLPYWFSFSPIEVFTFVSGRPHQKPVVIYDLAQLIWENYRDHANQPKTR